MLRARPGNFRVTDFLTGGQPDLSWYQEYARYETVVYGDTGELVSVLGLGFGIKNAVGSAIIPATAINPKNLLKDSSDWYIESMTSSPPVLTGNTFVNQRTDDLVSIIREMIRIAAVVGHGAVYSSDGNINLVSGTNIAPIQTPGNPIPDGWILFWPFYQRPENDRICLLYTSPSPRDS